MTAESASSQVVAERVNLICEVMREGLWKRGHSASVYADKWGVAENTVEKLAAEAWRRVCAESDDPDVMRSQISGVLRTNLMRADKVMNFAAIAKIAETYTKVIGARAPERHEHAVVISQFETLTTEGKISWIDERIKKLQDARAVLVGTIDTETQHSKLLTP